MGDINIRALAKALNLSIGTISKALRDSYEISAETKERVHALALKLGYTANPYASSLRRKKSNTIAVVIPDVADSFFSLAIKGIEDIAQEKSYHVLIYLTFESFVKEQLILNDFKSGRVDAVIMSISSETSDYLHIEALNASKIPVVFFDRVPEEMQSAKITTNDFESSYLAAELLIKQGCKRIIYLSISKFLSINNKRIEGYKSALAHHNIELSNADIIQCSNDNDYNYIALQKVMQMKKPPDGIIASVEKLIVPAYLVCKDLQIPIPGEVKVIGFSNLETALILNPSLTTITQPAFEMGKTAATVLFKALEKRSYNLNGENIILPSTLFIRESTGTPSASE